MDAYVTRLLQLSATCDFHNIDEAIRDQVVEKCLSVVLKKRLLRESDLTLSRLLEKARSMESAERQVQQISQDKKTDVNMIQTKHKKQFHKQSKKISQSRSAARDQR